MRVADRMTFKGLVAAAAMLAVAGCTSASPTPATNATPTAGGASQAPTAPAPTATTVPAANPWVSVSAIVDPTNNGWPRQVKTSTGVTTIQKKPLRVHTVSLGHDEITYGLVPKERVVAVGKFTQDPVYSNVAALAKSAPAVGREPEAIIAQRPDIVIASRFTKADLVKALENAGITVVQSDLDNTINNRISEILLLGYMLGEEARALELAAEVKARYDYLLSITGALPAASRPRVLALTSFSDKVYTAGLNSTEGSIIEAAGGLNVAAQAGIERNPTIGVEGIVSMRPEYIIIAQPPDSGNPFKQQLLSNPALAEVPAIKKGQVFLVEARLFTTLSFWNIQGAENLAKTLLPEKIAGKNFPDFSLPKG